MMNKKIIVIIGLIFVFGVVGLLLYSPLFERSFPPGDYEVKLSEGDNAYRFSSDQMEEVLIECDECDKKEECAFVCVNECSSRDLLYLSVLPTFSPELEKIGECPCNCYSPGHVNDFIFLKALKNKSIDECDEINPEMIVMGRDNCYIFTIMALQNESLCEKFLNNTMKNQCYFRIAVMKKDVDICSNIVFDEYSDWTEPLCEEFISDGMDFRFAIPE